MLRITAASADVVQYAPQIDSSRYEELSLILELLKPIRLIKTTGQYVNSGRIAAKKIVQLTDKIINSAQHPFEPIKDPSCLLTEIVEMFLKS